MRDDDGVRGAGDRADALKEGAYDYLKKPVNGVDLLRTLERCFEVLKLSRQEERAEEGLRHRNQELSEINERLRRMVASAESLAGCLQLNSLGPLILREFAHLMAAQGGSIFVRRDDQLVCLSTIGDREPPESLAIPLPDKSPIARAINDGKPLLVEDIEKEESLRPSGWPGYRDGSLLVFPLLAEGGETEGVVTLHNKRWPPFSEQDRELGQIMASLCTELLRSLRSTAALRESETRFRELAELLPEICFETDVNGFVTWANAQAFLISGYTSADASEGGFLGIQLIAAEDQPRLIERLPAVLRGDPNLTGIEVKAQRKSGETFPVIARAARIVRNGEVVGMRGLLIYVSELKETQAQLESERNNLEFMVAQRTRELTETLEKVETVNRELHEANEHKRRFF